MQPYYVFPNGYQNNGFNYTAPQMPNYYNGQAQMPQNAQNQPLNGFQQPQGQFVQQQPSQPVSNGSQQGFPIKDIRFVTSDEAKAFIVMPNSNALLLDVPNGMAYLKSADSVGQSVTECYKFTKITEADTTAKPPVEKKPDIDFSQYVTKQDILNYIDKFGLVTADQLKEELNNLKKQINGGNNRVGKQNNG